jgi:hypothetical protein
MKILASLARALAVGALLVPTLFATTMTNLSSFGGIEEPVRIYHPSSNSFTTDSFVNITDVTPGTIQTLLRYSTSAWDGDRSTGNTDRGRAEVKTLGANQKINETFDYTTTWRTNTGFKGSGGFCHITQLKGVDGTEATSGAPMVVTSINSGTSSAVVRYASTSFSPHNVFTTRVARNVTWAPNTWLALRIRVRATADGATGGQVTASINGDALQGVTNVEVSRPEAQTYYPKWGVYRKQETSSGFSANDFIQHSNVSATKITGTNFTITASAGANGSISPSGSVSVAQGANQTFTISPNAGFSVASVTVDGASVGAVTSFTFSNVQAAHTISATFQAVATNFTINASAGANGAISPSGAVSVAQGANRTFTITPNTGFVVAGVTVDGASAGAVTSYTFSNVQANHTISATFTASSGALSFEAEALTRTSSGATTTLQTDANTSGGQWVSLDSNANGQFIEFTLPNIPAGTYSLALRYKTNNNRGILSLKVDGTQIGGTLDQYASPSTYPSTTFGNVTFATAGSHVVRLTVTGRNGSSSSSTLSADKFTLTSTTTPPPTVTLEAESLTSVTSGPTVTTGNDAAASGGVVTYFNATAAAQWVEFTTPSIPAGTYSVRLQYKQNTARGQHTLSIDGTQVGGTVDEYATTSSYVQTTLGNVTFASAGTHTIRLNVTGKNGSSSSFVLAPDKFTLVGQ